MKILKTLLIPLAVLVLLSCEKKEYPESIVVNDPQFYAKFSLNNSPVQLSAGISNYRIYSSYTQDTTGIYKFISEIKPSNCQTNCANSLKIEISDLKKRPSNASVTMSDAIKLAPYVYSSYLQEAQFQCNYNKPAQTYSWSFGDGNISQEENPRYLYSKPGYYNVCLIIKGINGCESSICNKIKIGFPEGSCATSIAAESDSNNTVNFTQLTTGKAPFIYSWEFGDGKSSSQPNPSHNYAISGSYPVRLTVIDANKDVSVANYNVVTSNDLSSCSSNFKLSSNSSFPQLMQLSEVKVTYVDVNGIVFVSDEKLQPSYSKFEIVSVEDFEDNERGEATKKLTVKFTCNVYNGAQSLKIENAEAIISVAYKK